MTVMLAGGHVMYHHILIVRYEERKPAYPFSSLHTKVVTAVENVAFISITTL
jgi:hypothetical protein